MQRDDFHALVEAVRGFVRTDVPQHQEELFRTERLPDALRTRMAELGLFGMDIPESWGGLGLNAVDTCAVVEELCHGPQALVRWAGPSNGWVLQADLDPQLQALATKYVPGALSGHIRTAFTLSEPGAGTDAVAISTRAERRGDEYILNGRKHLISFAGAASAYFTFAKTDPEAGAHGVTAFFVDADTPGLSTPPTDPKLGLDGMPVGQVVFEDCVVPASQRVGPEGAGFMVAMQGLDAGRLKLIAAVAVGAAQEVLDVSLAAVREGTCGCDADWAHMAIADMATQITAARELVHVCAAKLDAGERITTESAMCKLFCAEMNDRVAALGVQIAGEPALEPAHPINRLYRDARLGRLWDGTSEIQRYIIARDLLRG